MISNASGELSVVIISFTSILFWVSVPVLSLQMMLVPPKVSTAESFFTITFCLAIFIIPLAKANVATMGKPSGIAATASAMEVCSMVKKF